MERLDVRLRACTAEDHDMLRRAHHEGLGPYIRRTWGWDEAVQDGFVKDWLAVDHPQVIEVDGRAAGYLEVVAHADHLRLSNIVLLPAFQRQGIGTRLVRDVIGRAEARRLPIRLQVLHPNPARALYKRLGFRETGRDAHHVQMERACTLAPETP